MDKLKQKLRKENVSLSRTDNRFSKSAVIGSVLGTIIALTPLLYSIHESVPTEKVWSTFLFTYDSNVWEDAQYAMWVFTGKIVPLLLLLIWFFTNRHWWYHALIVPIVMYIFQIVITYRVESNYIDEFQILYLLPIIAIVVPSIYLIRARMFNKINDADKSMQELEEEFMYRPTTFWGKVKQYF